MTKGLRNDFTQRLIQAHIQPGMHVLDAGCGNGEVTFLIADAVGNSGQVDGIDISSDAIESAQEKARELDKKNISFCLSDITESGEEQYDAIFGRRILMYQKDPKSTIDILKKILKPGGIMLFQESDEKGSLLNGPDMPLHNQAQDWIWRTVEYEGGDIHIGSELYTMMQEADLHVVDYRAEAVIQTPETGSDLAWVVSVMQERMKAAGVNPETDHLEERLNDEMKKADHAFIRDLAFGICAKKN